MLIVDTRDAARAPMLAVLIGRAASGAGIGIRTCSAGTRAGTGVVHPDAVDAVARRGCDLSHHRPVRLEAAHLRTDLVLTATREHARAALALDRAAWPRIFTVREFLRRSVAAGPPARREPLEDWLVRVAGDRRRSSFAGNSSSDDIDDLAGSGPMGHHDAARDYQGYATRLVSAMLGR